MTQKVVVVRSGISSLTLLTIVFIALKLANFISWSWWWVLSPLWIPWAVGIACLILAGLGALVVMLVEAYYNQKRKF